MLAALYTSLLIYIQQDSPPPGQEKLHEAAQSYARWFRDTEWNILIPTPVIAEFLSSRDRTKRQKVLKAFQDFADIQPFDLRASDLAGQIRLDYIDEHGLPDRGDPRRHMVTVDMMIAAVAIVNRASLIVTHDVDDFEEITADFERIEVRDVLEPPPGQGKLFDE